MALFRSRTKRSANRGDAVAAEVDIAPRRIRLGDGAAASFVVVGYPAEVGYGWLEPLLTYPGRLDVSLHVEPVPPNVAADRLRRQMARLEASSRTGAEKGKLEDFEAEGAAEDARDMASSLARGEGKLFRVGLYVTVHATTEEELEEEVGHVQSLASSMLLDARPATYRQLHGWTSCLPLGVDLVEQRRSMDTAALSASYPFASPDLAVEASPTAVLYGLNSDSSGVVVWDRWALDTYNTVVLARSGAGKSYFCKLDLLRSMYAGVSAAVIDPEDEYSRLADAVGATVIRLGAPGVHLNPLDLALDRSARRDALSRRALFLHTLLAVMLGGALSPHQRAAFDRALIATYRQAGITADERTWNRPAPLLADLVATLQSEPDEHARDLAVQLAPYTTGSHRELFRAPTSRRPQGHLVSWSLRDLPEELKAIGTLMALDSIWRTVADSTPDHPRMVLVDEGWLLMAEPEGAKFLFRLAKAARKRWVGLTVATQDAADVLGSELGKAVVANSATQVLMRQAPQAIDQITAAFGLSDGERQHLLTASPGDALLCSGDRRVAFQVVASDYEHQLVTTNPAELNLPDRPDGTADAALDVDGLDEEDDLL
ncbi:type IV secretory pathway VirB4 component [Spinactinospora alkalitolerans]|uniref:Type IV secretory pathway VirB4 component n=1 Tax=Spinactinospora alkalitolerans TaxID=687207 RepID=A0A852U1J7_9ACTN|nr:conjugal transfer protein TraC [Spinactinospora alkalitolerans]NYE50001.1 type IV secretory pathway VirB4 component [Spinactinospora alkalitolerans]